MATLIESGTRKGVYDITARDALVDDPQHGRLYITEGYGGESSPDGGTYRWRHGMAVPVADDATLEESRKIDPRYYRAGVLEWDGEAMERYARSLGL